MAKKMGNFLGHCFFTPFYPIVFFANPSFSLQVLGYSWLNSDTPHRSGSI